MVRRLLLVPTLCGLSLLLGATLVQAQTRPASPAKPATVKPAEGKPGESKTVPVAGEKNARPAAPASEPDVALDVVLEEWYQSSKTIQKLEGKHSRFIYDYQWAVLKRADGEFYYESPDTGRIDLQPAKIAQGAKMDKVSPINGDKVSFVVQPDLPERWVCDGTQILEINDTEKSVTPYEIPKEARGSNIMDGPLPFLFGMPPERAKQRYTMKLVQSSASRYVIRVEPKWQQDAANYKWAVVVLERKTMMPEAVQMIDPAETTETVYTFPEVQKNPKKGNFISTLLNRNQDPFKPDLKGYKFIDSGKVAEKKSVVERDPKSKAPPTGDPVVPSVIGLEFEEAKKILEARGYKAQFFKGKPANTPQQTFHAYEQVPAPKTQLAQGSIVKVQVFTEPPIETTKAVDRGADAPAKGGDRNGLSMPNVRGLPFKDAEQRLKDGGYEVKFVRGRVAARPEDVFKVESQSPPAGTKMREGDTVTLTLFIAEPAAKK